MMLILFVILAILCLWTCKKPTNFPPGPAWWPLVGNLPIVRKRLLALGFQFKVWDELVEKYGPIVGLKLGAHRVVLIAGNDLIREVSSKEEFNGRPDGFYWRYRSEGQRLGVVFIEGPVWEEHRKFTLQHLKKFGLGSSVMRDLIEHEAAELVEWLKQHTDRPINMVNFFNISVLNILWMLIAGKRYSNDDEKLKQVCNAIYENFRLLDSSGGLLQQMPFLRHIIPERSGFNMVTRNFRIFKEFLNEIIEEHDRTLKQHIERDLLDSFLHKMRLNDDPTYTYAQLRLIALDLLQAGSETTSNTLNFLILYMIKYEDIQKKVHREIDDVLGRDRRPCFEDRHKMPYLSAVIQEVHRFASVANTGVPHRTVSDVRFHDYEIPKDTTVLFLLRNMHMDKRWGDPDVFRPERFLINGKLIEDEWLGAFGYGRRKCIGENLARANIFLFSVYLLQSFKIAKNPELNDINVEMINGITLSPKSFDAVWILRK